MITAERMEVLRTFLASLPDRAAMRLAQAVEYDFLTGGTALPHDVILEALRPALRRMQSTGRAPSPLRLFCRPFEDILVSDRTGAKQKGRIARSSIRRVWRWLAETLLAEEAAEFVLRVKDAVARRRPEESMPHARRLWSLAAAALRQALADPEQARAALGDDAAVADAQEMALLLSVASEITELQGKLTKPVPQLTDELLWTLRGVYDRLVATVPDAAPYVAVIAMNRLARPWEALRLPLMVARQSDDTLISSTDMGLVGELLLADMDAHAFAIRTARPPNYDAEALCTHVASFAQLSSGIATEIEMRRGGRWSQRLMKDRASVGEVMEEHVKRAARDILAAIPTIKSGAYAGGPRVPDLVRAFDADRAERGVNAARLIAGCRNSAQGACFAAALTGADEDVATGLKSYSEELVRELRAAEGERRALAERYFALAATFTDILFSPEEGEFLRRRGRAAATPQAA